MITKDTHGLKLIVSQPNVERHPGLPDYVGCQAKVRQARIHRTMRDATESFCSLEDQFARATTWNDLEEAKPVPKFDWGGLGHQTLNYVLIGFVLVGIVMMALSWMGWI